MGRNSLLYLIGALFQGLGIVFVQPFAIRVLDSDAQWGELILAVSVIQVGVVLAAAGLPLAITRAWFDEGNGPLKARSISGFLSITGFALGVLAAAVAAVFAARVDGVITFTIALGAMGVLATVLAAQAMLRAQERPLAFVGLSIGSSVGAHVLGLLAIWLIEPLAWVYLAGFAVSVVATAAVSLMLARPASPRAVKGAVGEALSIGLPVLPHTGALMLLTQGAVFLLAATAGTVASGDFGKVQIFTLGTITVLGALNNAWVPSLMGAPLTERARRLRRTMKIASLAGLAVVVVAAGGANAVTHIIANGREDLVPVAQVLPLTAVGYLLYLNATTLLFADKRTGLLAVITPVVLLAGLAFAYLPARSGNLVGVAVACSASFLLLGLSYFAVARHRAEGGWPVRLYLLCAAAGLAYVLVLLALPNDLATGVITIAVVAVLGLAALGILRTRLRQLTAE
ncbi:lipopolysaccharide biosynthesis protein [Arthrobacter zhaoguopingii]|uniref:lipopolysaccharide biosynthesis protein n=1 Tax=Arthrobacter zhaoguopingii TaxID=2681491 RepID=UPI001357B2E1|nr:hypothetical protein [Arthrobacter zhaoguopingii]